MNNIYIYIYMEILYLNIFKLDGYHIYIHIWISYMDIIYIYICKLLLVVGI